MYLEMYRIRSDEELVQDEGRRHKSTIVEALAYRLIVGSLRWPTDDEDEGLTVRILLKVGELFG